MYKKGELLLVSLIGFVISLMMVVGYQHYTILLLRERVILQDKYIALVVHYLDTEENIRMRYESTIDYVMTGLGLADRMIIASKKGKSISNALGGPVNDIEVNICDAEKNNYCVSCDMIDMCR